MQAFLDESGDLGWVLDKPYRHGGSSKFLTLAFLLLPPSDRNAAKHLMRSMYDRFGWKNEAKASKATDEQMRIFCEKTVEMVRRRNQIKIETMTVKKCNVQPHIRGDENKLYNYMVWLIFRDNVPMSGEVEFIPDMRSIKVKSGHSLGDYLQTTVWFETPSTCKINCNPTESHKCYSLQFVDWIAHAIWSRYEDEQHDYFELLRPCVTPKTLFWGTA